MMNDFIEKCRRDTWGTYLGNGRIACRVLGKYNAVVDANDIGLTPNLVCDGFWEPDISVVFEKVLRPGMTAVDIGANIGYFSLLMASQVGPEGRVIAIEANPALAVLLRETIAMNGLGDRIELHNVAAADKAGVLDFHVRPDRNLNGGLVLDDWRGQIDPADMTSVRALPPDELLAGLKKIDFIKIDVEGAEHLVWQGLQQTLKRNPDVIVVLEYNFMRHSQAGTLIPMIEALGFPLRYIHSDGAVRPIDRAALFDSNRLADWMLFLQRGEGAMA